jgi:hypothetical protein
MTISHGARLALALICSAATGLQAQKRVMVPDDSIGAMIGVESRLLWRDITLADALGLQSGVSFPVRFPRLPMQLEVDGWTTLARRSSRNYSDQYTASAHYQWILADRPHPKSLVFGYAEYWNPIGGPGNQPDRANTRELTVSGLFDIGIQQLGIRTVHFQLDGARDLARERATWIRGSANASLGTTIQGARTDYSLTAILELAVSGSDLRGPLLSGPRSAFEFHSANAELNLQFRTRLQALDATTALTFGTVARAKRLGANIGWVGLRQSFLLL